MKIITDKRYHIVAVFERRLANGFYITGNRNCAQISAVFKRALVDELNVLDTINDSKLCTAHECAVVDGPHSVREVQCGQCVNVCPTGALMEHSEIDKVDAAFKAGKHVIVQAAPAVRAALGEEFGMPIGTNVEGKMVAALRRLGFDKVFDTDAAADVTIVEEANELVERIQNGGVLPMITSCSPGWVKFAELYYPEQLANLSTCKSPQQMFGGLLKTYYAERGLLAVVKGADEVKETTARTLRALGVEDV